MWKYLDLVDRTSPLIEDFYLIILKLLDLERPNKLTIFLSIHWQGFRNIILKDTTIRLILGQIEKWRESGYASGNPGIWIDKIRLIRS